MSYIKHLKDELKVHRQAIAEIRHAFEAGPVWYTKGESGLRQQVRMWLEKSEAAQKAGMQ